MNGGDEQLRLLAPMGVDELSGLLNEQHTEVKLLASEAGRARKAVRDAKERREKTIEELTIRWRKEHNIADPPLAVQEVLPLDDDDEEEEGE